MAEEGTTPAAAQIGKDLVVALHVTAGQNLKGIAKTVDGAGFAFTHLELPGAEPQDGAEDERIGNIEALKDYTHLRYVNLSSHVIADPGPLVDMKHLLSLNLAGNALTTESLEKFKEAPLRFLQVLNLNSNRIEEYALDFPMLRELYLSKNKLNQVKIAPESAVLKLLDLSDQDAPPEPAEGEEPAPPKGLQDCDGFGLPSLETLIVRGNPIKSLNGLENLTGVTELDFSKTEDGKGGLVESLDGLPAGGKLSKLLLTDCPIKAWEEIDKLKEVSSLTDLTLDLDRSQLPALGDAKLRGRVLFRCPSLKELDGGPITDDDRADAKEPDPEPAPAEAAP
jgi:hypothetical protein